MSSQLSMKELRSKELPEVQKILSEIKTELRSLRVKAAAQDLKNVRLIRIARQQIARLLTRVRELKSSSK